jgi:hypothetical protein
VSTQRERMPNGSNWTYAGRIENGSVWESGPVRVISTLDMATLPDGSGIIGPQWHISIARRGKRPHATDVRRTLRAFRMVGAEEDNHHPGNARHFWVVCDPAKRVDCECKEDEVLVTDADGYRWTNPAEGEPCRGCEFQSLTGKSCPLHAASGERVIVSPDFASSTDRPANPGPHGATGAGEE